MGMPAPMHHWTRQEVMALPDDGMRHELFDGELVVTPAPRRTHQLVQMRLVKLLLDYLERVPAGTLLVAPADLPLGGGQVAQPDIFILPDAAFEEDWSNAPIPLLVIEVSSPSSARHDRGLKRRAYQHAGVQEYWIVDVDARLIERWRPDDARPEVEFESLRWQPLADSMPLLLEVQALLRTP